MDDLIEEFNSFTGNDDNNIAREWLEKHDNNVDEAGTAYFSNYTPPAFPAQEPDEPNLDILTAKFVNATGADTSEAGLWLLQSDNDLERAIEDYGAYIVTQSSSTPSTSSAQTLVGTYNEPPPPPLGTPSTWTVETAKKWLSTSSTWIGLGNPSHWTGIRILGKGGFGVAGLWQYVGPAHLAPVSGIRELCVKQTVVGRTEKRDVYEEGRILKMLSEVDGCTHVVKMYGGVEEDVFEGLGVVRLFLEYCVGGDLGRVVDAKDGNPAPINEGDVWEIFECLAKGIMVMDRGTEDEGKDRWLKDTEICHFDLKTENSKISEFYQSIADFGEALELPKTQDDDFGARKFERGDMTWWPPEEKPEPGGPLRHPRKGTCSNIYQLGCIIQHLLLRSLSRGGCSPPFFGKLAPESTSSVRLIEGQTHGIELHRLQKIKEMYSKTLRELVMECMIREPMDRPSVLELLRRVREGRRVYERIAGWNEEERRWSWEWVDTPVGIVAEPVEEVWSGWMSRWGW